MSYVVVFCLGLLLLKLPFFLFRVLLRFAKPITLIGFGCFLGVSLTTGVPNPSDFDYQQAANKASKAEFELPALDEVVSPEVVDAAISTAGELSDSVVEMFENLQTAWNQDTQKKMTFARNSSESDFRGIDRSLRKR